MRKKLSELSLAELWELFPIFLTAHQDCWKIWYEEESSFLQAILPLKDVKRISHIGSTAVASIWAKPIVDVLVEITSEANMDQIKRILTRTGWTCMNQSENRMSFNKGYTESGFAEKVYHLHLRYAGDNNELYFRDYLNDHPQIAKEYEKLKLHLWKEHEQNRDAYTNAKTQFVERYTNQARQEYADKYC